MADSLFDNRYRYDYIYPRGRSGESLRALDMNDNQRKVVIKRPAPNDAPPIRAGQEVSIVNERRALQRLAGHPVLTELLGEGQFFVGGMPHQYIVMERAEGLIIGEEVLRLNASNERLPELEMLVIVDSLLDLLHGAHNKEIIYNDVDAKHLFWNRETYRLKAIDWGNAVFLEGDEVTPQGISRQTDVYQVGELLYFIVTGGRRAEVPRDAGEDFRIDFGEDSRRIHSRLQEIISKALHPNARFRYPNLTALRAELSNYRSPIERERNSGVSRVIERLKRDDLSMAELRTLKNALEPVLRQDPAYPPAVEAFNTVEDKLRDLSVEADLDAVRIYMQSGNWNRAAELLRQLRDKAGTKTSGLINLLLDICVILTDEHVEPVPTIIRDAIGQLFEGANTAAALSLLQDTPDDRQRALQWQLAERISSHLPDVLLLRPNLYRISNALKQVAIEGFAVDEPRSLLSQVDKTLDDIANGALNVAFLRDSYRAVVEKLTALNPILQTFAAQHQLSTKRVPVNALERALSAAMAMADSMHIIGKQAAANPREALHALESSRVIDPTNPIWFDLDDLLKRLYERLQTSQTFVPAADGGDLQSWLETTRDKLRPFQERLFDEMLANMLKGTEVALESWKSYQEVVLMGNRDRAVASLEQASQAVSTISPALSQWFHQLRVVVEGANYIERHALPGGLGRALADGWAAFDRGRLTDSERLGQQGIEIARTETARLASMRLQDLSRLTREWVERNGVANQKRSKEYFDAVEKLFTQKERDTLSNFESQMPSIETYLKAMSRGLVAQFEASSTAALRVLFIYYIAQGALDVHEGLLDDGLFWRDAAKKALVETGERHVATRTLEEYITHRRDLLEAGALFAQVNGKQILPELHNVRRKLENNAQARLLGSGIQSLRDIEVALRSWSDGDFRAAGMKLEESVKGVSEVENAANLKLEGLRAWLMELMEAAASLSVQAREMRLVIDKRPDAPESSVGRILEQQVHLTERMVGEGYAATLRQWRDTYQQYVSILTSDERRSKRLERLNELFRALFIDQHPAYPLYRHWYALLEEQSEFAAPPSSDPTPREDSSEIPEIIYRNREADVQADILPPTARRKFPRGLIFGGVIASAVLALGFIGMSLLNRPETPTIALTISPTPNEETQAAVTSASEAVVIPTTAPIATSPAPQDTPTRIITVTQAPTQLEPTASDTATVTPSPSNTPTATHTPSITPTTPPPTMTALPEGGLHGRQDLLALFNRTPNLPFNNEIFFPLEGGYRFGNGAEADGEVLQIAPPLDYFEASFGDNAASRLTSVEAEIALATFNPVLLNEADAIFFGLALQSASDGNIVGVQINVINSTSIEVRELQNNSTSPLRTRSVSTVVVRLRIDRDLQTGAVILFLNDEQLSPAISFLDANAPLIPVVYVRDGGVVLRVTDWRINLR
jgi:hypothetical protein